MKSRNLKAIFAALTTAAVMATATTSFAAVTSTATYNDVNGKVKINVAIADESKPVTYKAVSGGKIVYIDQATADFSYYVDSAEVADLAISVDSNAGPGNISLATETLAAPEATKVPAESEEGKSVMFVLQTVGKPAEFGLKAGDLKLRSLAPAGATKAAIKVVLEGATDADFVPYAE